jgi:hypothetical protein
MDIAAYCDWGLDGLDAGLLEQECFYSFAELFDGVFGEDGAGEDAFNALIEIHRLLLYINYKIWEYGIWVFEIGIENHRINNVWEVVGLRILLLFFRLRVRVPHFLLSNKYFLGEDYGESYSRGWCLFVCYYRFSSLMFMRKLLIFLRYVVSFCHFSYDFPLVFLCVYSNISERLGCLILEYSVIYYCNYRNDCLSTFLSK